MSDRPYVPPDSCAPNPEYYPGVKAYEKDGKKFVSIHGKEIEVRPDEECSNCELRLCALVEQLPEACGEWSKQSTCHFCHKPVWYDTRLPIGEKQKLICMPCAVIEGGQDSFAS